MYLPNSYPYTYFLSVYQFITLSMVQERVGFFFLFCVKWNFYCLELYCTFTVRSVFLQQRLCKTTLVQRLSGWAQIFFFFGCMSADVPTTCFSYCTVVIRVPNNKDSGISYYCPVQFIGYTEVTSTREKCSCCPWAGKN